MEGVRFEVSDGIDGLEKAPIGSEYIGDNFYLIKDKHYIYLCTRCVGSKEWPEDFKRIFTITPTRMQAIRELSMRLPGYGV